MMADFIAADPQVLLAGGVDLTKVADAIDTLKSDLDPVSHEQYFTTNGEDQITKILSEKYVPAARACMDFLEMLSGTVAGHGGSVVDSGKTLSASDDAATEAAVGRRG